MTTAYLALGSNIGDRHRLIQEAVVYISMEAGSIISLSSLYETQPEGFVSANPFLNAVVEIETSLTPQELLIATQKIEFRLGRTSKSIDGIYHDRTIDIDLLMMGDTIVDTPHLTLPHPRMHMRKFVLAPLCEIAPALVHPILHRTIAELWHTIQHDVTTSEGQK